MKVKIKKMAEGAVMPFKTHEGDFCYDVKATSLEKLSENVYKYGIGLAFEIDIADKAKAARINNILDIDFRPRSSVWETGLVLSNCEGTLDEPYRGEVSAVFYKVAEGTPYKVGDKIGQIKLGITIPMEFEWADELTPTERGAKGYGSTGK